MLAQGVGDERRALHGVHGIVETAWERGDAPIGELGGVEIEEVALGLGRQLVAAVDAGEAGGQDDGEREIGIGGRVRRSVLESCRV